jgi:hypothetical protein
MRDTRRGHLRPDKQGRERPPSIRGRGQVCGSRGGSLTPRFATFSIRAASAAAQGAADASRIEHTHVHGAKRVWLYLVRASAASWSGDCGLIRPR